MQEFSFLDRLKKELGPSRAELGLGDDASVLKLPHRGRLLQSMDLLVEGVHFQRPQISWRDLGYKSLAVNISDINAMGGQAAWVHLGLALPAQVRQIELDEFYQGFLELARAEGLELLGGDLCRSPGPVMISVHVSGWCKAKHLKLRSGFAHADLLAVTGPLGDSSLGLDVQQRGEVSTVAGVLRERHHRPPVLTAEARFLAGEKAVVGLMDLSDGLQSDLRRLPELEVVIDVEKIPVSEAARTYCREHRLDVASYAVSGGEDYQLLVGLKEKGSEKVLRRYQERFASPLHIIGLCSGQSGLRSLQYKIGSEPWTSKIASFSHFSEAND